jgi:hypothetical protein
MSEKPYPSIYDATKHCCGPICAECELVMLKANDEIDALRTTIASLRAENERLTTLLAAAQAECDTWKLHCLDKFFAKHGNEEDFRLSVESMRALQAAIAAHDAARRKVQG